MKYLLDTNICSFLIRQKSATAAAKLAAQIVGDVGLSSITLAELQYGVAKSSNPFKNGAALGQFLLPLTVLEFDGLAAACYGTIRAALERAGLVIGPLDMLIAAHAVSHGIIVVTNNVREFSRVPNLVVEDWPVP